MKKIYTHFFSAIKSGFNGISYLFMILLVYSTSSWGQLLTWDTAGNIGNEATEPSTFNNVKIAPASLTKGAGIGNASVANRFGGVTWSLSLSLAVSGNDYIEFTVTPDSNFSFTPTSFEFIWDRTSNGAINATLRSSLDNFTTNLGTVTGMGIGEYTTIRTITISGLTEISVPTTFRLYGYGGFSGAASAGFGSGPGSPSPNIVLNGTTSPISTTWNGTTWTEGSPTATLEAIIDDAYSTASNGSFTCKKLTVNANKSLTINASTNLTIQNEVINNGTLTVESNANLIQVNNTSNTGQITVNRNSNALKRLDYTMWSSPVNGTQTLQNFSPLTSLTPVRFYSFDPNLGVSGLFATATPTSTFSTGTGYLIRMPNENPNDLGTNTPYYLGTTTLTYNGVFTGVPNNGLVSIPTTATKYYGVGNPYPSTISADSFITTNNITEALYFWRKTNNLNQQNAATTSYATYTLAGGVGTNPNGGITPNGIIQVGQGFIAKSAGTSLDFNNTMRIANNANQIFKVKKSIERNRVWLNLTSASGVFSQMMLAYMTGATQGIDPAIDGKYFNDSATALNSLINNEEFVIQGRSLPFDPSAVVDLAFKNNNAGTLTIAIDHLDGFFANNQDLYLMDNKTGIETNLKANSYTFHAEAGVDNTRFSLKFQKTLKLDEVDVDDKNLVVYKANNAIYISSKEKNINTVAIFDIQGKLIAQQNKLKTNLVSFKNLVSKNQLLLLKVTLTNNTVVTKKQMN